ncbi:hypothetical protein [Agrobacterium larrymoorei]|uniref:hypothetical protein n=1 Tax=Agrobacterium larrymoorei TaxID=160699 RepID=UPI0030BB5102
MDEDAAATRFMAVVDHMLRNASGGLQPTGAAIIAAIHMGIGNDSRSLSNQLGVAHALVLREISTLSGTLLRIVRRDARTQRTFVELTDEAQALAAATSKAFMKSSLSNFETP